MVRYILVSMRSITAIALCVVLFTGCSSLLIHDDDNIAVVATKVTVRTVNCALTMIFGCMSEWEFIAALVQRADVLGYLQSLADTPVPFPAP